MLVERAGVCEARDDVTVALLTFLGSLATGFLGGILGAGGGVFLVPYLVLVVGVRPIEAVSTSIVCVLGTAVGATGRALEDGRVNVPLALALEPFLVVGAVLAALFAQRIGDRALLIAFASLMLLLAVLLVARRTSHAVEPAPDDVSPFDGVAPDDEGRPVRYRPRRLGATLPLAAAAGASSGLFGIGGGALVVPILSLVARVPMRSATSTSAFTMATTGAAAALVHFAHGTVPAALVAASLLGVWPGGRLGARFQRRLSERTLGRVFALFAVVIAGLTLWRAGDA